MSIGLAIVRASQIARQQRQRERPQRDDPDRANRAAQRRCSRRVDRVDDVDAAGPARKSSRTAYSAAPSFTVSTVGSPRTRSGVSVRCVSAGSVLASTVSPEAITVPAPDNTDSSRA